VWAAVEVDAARTRPCAARGRRRAAGGHRYPNPFVVPGVSAAELSNLVDTGVAPVDAIVAATREAARFFGDQGRWGTIEVGKRADLLLLEADPLQDIRNVRRRVGVMARGRWMSEGARQAMISGISLR
jgi:imidazolonepropionase-like amidohydrolase